MNLETLAKVMEETRAMLEVLKTHVRTLAHNSIEQRSKLIQLRAQHAEAKKDLENKRATLLSNNAIEGKNAEVREANLRLALINEIEREEFLALAVSLQQLELDSAVAELNIEGQILTATIEDLKFLSNGPGVIPMLTVDTPPAGPSDTTVFSEGSGVFVHMTERDDTPLRRPEYSPED